ncbi:MAG: ABC transporter permease [Parafilimonas sp.]|nr:ABC transporter permease [Parafilimonas sp.]
MFKNYFTIAWRNIKRHKGYAAINITGLAVGMAACVLLFIVVQYEMSYEKFQPNYSRIYQIVTQDKYPDGMQYTPGVPFPAVDAVRADFPQVTTGALLASYGSQVTVLGNDAASNSSEKKFIEESGFVFADPQFFQVFHYNFLVGSAAVLKEPNQTILTQATATKYFGDWKNAVGKFLKLDNKAVVKVAGILQDVPANTDFPLRIVTSFETAKANAETYSYNNEWGSTTSNFQLFMLLPQNVSASAINSKLEHFVSRHNNVDRTARRTNFLQPLSNIHFDNRFGNLGDHVTTKSTLLTLSLIGVFIIVMACINFINLATAQAVNRSKEIGIRKVLGSNRRKLFWQMMGETAMIVCFSMIIAGILAYACLPSIKHIDSINEPLSIFTAKTILFLVTAGLVVTIFSGFYPSLVVSGFSPMSALKNKITSATIGGISLRRGLVVTQFAISQILIIGTIVAISQMNFIRNADLGFNKNAVFVLTSNWDSIQISRQPALKQQLLRLPGIESVSFSSDVPSSENNWSTNFAFDHRPDEKFNLFLKFADADYFKTFALQFAAGHAYAASDTVTDIVVNETLVKKLGLKNPNEAIGKQIKLGGNRWNNIVGVVKDFKTNSLREETKPTMLASSKRFYGNASVKIHSSNLTQTKDAILKTWDKFNPEFAPTSFFLDENINDFYKQENQLSLLYKIFAGIAIFISCLGLYGLVSFMAVQRTKEVGIRKVLGASVKNIVFLFSKEFTILIGVAFLVAAPLAWYMMNNWLSNFAYRIHISATTFIMAVIISIIIAWITVGYKSIVAALANPVKSLRTE